MMLFYKNNYFSTSEAALVDVAGAPEVAAAGSGARASVFLLVLGDG